VQTAIYGRVSTKSQKTDRQVDELMRVCRSSDWGEIEIFEEVVSGGKGRADRPVFDELLRRVTQRQIKRVCVWSVDRLGRSLTDLLATLEIIKSAGAALYIHSQAIDTATSSGKMMFSLIGVFSEFERSIIRERVKSGLEAARAKGKRLGRPPTPPSVIEKVRRLSKRGLSQRQIAQQSGVSQSKVSQIVNSR